MSAIMDAAYGLVHAYPGGAVSLAPRMGKSPTTLAHEVKRTGTAKFGLEDAVAATVLSGDLRILNAFAAEADCLVLPMPSAIASGVGSMHQVAQLAREFGDLVGAVTDAAADGRVSANELARMRREWSELLAAGQVLMQHMQELNDADQSGRPA